MRRRFRLVIFFLLAFFAISATARSAKDQSSSTLHLVIEPAFQVEVLKESPLEQSTLSSSRSQILGIRANTAWALQIDVQPSALTNSLTFTGQKSGSRNLDNDFQEIPITIKQDYSWSDPPGEQEIVIVYSAVSPLQ